MRKGIKAKGTFSMDTTLQEVVRLIILSAVTQVSGLIEVLWGEFTYYQVKTTVVYSIYEEVAS